MDLRTRKNWTQEKLADKAIVSVRTVQNIEGGRPTQRSTLVRLANALGVSAHDLIFVAAPAETTISRPGASIPAMEPLPHPKRRTKGLFSTVFVAFLLAEAAGIATWFVFGAAVFTPLQRYYWNEYLNTELFQGTKGNYRLLEVVDRRGEHRIAIDSDVAPAAIHGPQLVPFVLSAQARHSGAIDLAVDTVHYGSAQMHQVLATSIYAGRSVMEFSTPAWGVGLGVFALRIFLLVRYRNRRRRLEVAEGSEGHG